MWHVWRYASHLLLTFLVLEATYTLAATSSDMIQLGMNKIARNSEIERLFVNYDAHIASNVVNATENAARFSQSVELLMDPNHPFAVESRIIASDGSHTIKVLVGGQMMELIIDTGSGKTAFICEGCHKCGTNHHDHPFKFTNNTVYLPCDPAHLEDDGHDGSCMECHQGKCKYGQRYVEGDSWEAYKVSDMMAFSIHDPDFQAKVEFGCIYEQTGLFSAQLSDGIMGFSRHPDSIFEQFYRAGTTQSRIFAQCLADDGGVLTLGGVDMSVNTKPMVYTPLRDTGYQYWTVHLESVTIGTLDLGVSEREYNADRGCVFDSGTTFVYFPTTIKQSFITAWKNAMHQAGQNIAPPIGDTYHSLSDTLVSSLPNICFHFSNHVELCMPPTSYFYRINSNAYAGTIYFGDGGHATIVGASALMHHNVLYDQDHHRIGIAPADCTAASAAVAMAEDGQQIERVALELHPGGPTFETTFDKNYWSNWVLASVTFFAVAGLVHAVWTQVTEPLDEELEKKAKLDKPQKVETIVEMRTTEDGVGLDPRPCESEEEAFAFVLMQE